MKEDNQDNININISDTYFADDFKNSDFNIDNTQNEKAHLPYINSLLDNKQVVNCDYGTDITITDLTNNNDKDSELKGNKLVKAGFLVKQPFLANFWFGLFFGIGFYFSLISPTTSLIYWILFIVYIGLFLNYSHAYSNKKYISALLFGISTAVGTFIAVLMFGMMIGSR